MGEGSVARSSSREGQGEQQEQERGGGGVQQKRGRGARSEVKRVGRMGLSRSGA
jgi:hypothetical protein